MTRPRLLDLFCGAGGAAVGYHRAGFDVVGVDIKPQPRYPFEFIQADAMTFPLDGFDVIHASPPCQRYSVMSKCREGLGESYEDLIVTMRDRFRCSGIRWVIENVPGSPLISPIRLCGRMFGLELYRHRHFESNMAITQPNHAKHDIAGGRAGHWKPGQIVSVCGNCAPIALAKKAMGIDWMRRDELSEAIPPAYTEYIGKQLIRVMEAR